MRKINKIILAIIAIFLVVFLGLLFSGEIAIDIGIPIEGTVIENSFDFESEFNDNRMIDTIYHFSEKSTNEKEEYIKKLASAKGYKDFYDFYSDEKFEVWGVQNDPNNPTKAANVIIKINTGEVVISNI